MASIFLKHILGAKIKLLICVVLLNDYVHAQGFHVGVKSTSCSLDPESYNDPCKSLYDAICDGAHCKCPPGTNEDQSLKKCIAGATKAGGSTKKTGGGGDLFDLPLDYVPGDKPKDKPNPEEETHPYPPDAPKQPSLPVQPAQPMPPSRPAQPAQPRPPVEPQGPSQGYNPRNINTNTNQMGQSEQSGKLPTHTGYPGHPNGQPRQPEYTNQAGTSVNRPGYDHRTPGSNPNQPSYNPNRSGYDHNQPGYDSSQPGYYPNQPGVYNPNRPAGGGGYPGTKGNEGMGTYYGGEKSLFDGFKKRSKNKKSI